jgi:hypothetical protein
VDTHPIPNDPNSQTAIRLLQPSFSAKMDGMKFEDAIRHLRSIGLAAVMPDGELRRKSA